MRIKVIQHQGFGSTISICKMVLGIESITTAVGFIEVIVKRILIQITHYAEVGLVPHLACTLRQLAILLLAPATETVGLTADLAPAVVVHGRPVVVTGRTGSTCPQEVGFRRSIVNAVLFRRVADREDRLLIVRRSPDAVEIRLKSESIITDYIFEVSLGGLNVGCSTGGMVACSHLGAPEINLACKHFRCSFAPVIVLFIGFEHIV